MITVEADRIAAFGAAEPDTSFVLVTNSRLRDAFTVHSNGKYSATHVVTYDGGQPFTNLLGVLIPDRAHILTILPDCLLQSVPRETLSRYKLLIMACRSGQIGLDGIAHFLECGYCTDLESQQKTAEALFARGQASTQLVLRNAVHGTECRFEHLKETYEWHEQLGVLDWGDQQVFPCGEVACFAVPLYGETLDARSIVELSGTVALQGLAIVQSGPPSFVLADQLRIFESLASLRGAALIFEIDGGVVRSHRAADSSARPAEQMLGHLFAVDSRYRNVYEIGFSINEQLVPWPGNAAMNEVWGQGGGNIHLGLGMLPHTQYHLDLFCQGTRAWNERGELVFGAEEAPPAVLRRVRSGGCPCIAL